jgi:hypothetical protein
MKPRRRPAPTAAAKRAVKAKKDRRRRRGLNATRRAVRTGDAVVRALGPARPPRRRKPARRNVRSRATSVAKAGRVSARRAPRSRAA